MTARRQIHLGAVPYGTGGPGSHTLWLDPEIPGDASVDVDWFIQTAQLAERGKFDLVFIVDSQFITPYSPPHYLNRLEPLTLLSALATQIKRTAPWPPRSCCSWSRSGSDRTSPTS